MSNLYEVNIDWKDLRTPLTDVDPVRVDTKGMWEAFDTLVPEAADGLTTGWGGHPLPSLPCVEDVEFDDPDLGGPSGYKVLFVAKEHFDSWGGVIPAFVDWRYSTWSNREYSEDIEDWSCIFVYNGQSSFAIWLYQKAVSRIDIMNAGFAEKLAFEPCGLDSQGHTIIPEYERLRSYSGVKEQG